MCIGCYRTEHIARLLAYLNHEDALYVEILDVWETLEQTLSRVLHVPEGDPRLEVWEIIN